MTQTEEVNSEETLEETELIESNSDYNAENIDVLEGLEAVRKDVRCILALPLHKDCITWCMKLWITLLMKHWLTLYRDSCQDSRRWFLLRFR